MLIYNIKTLVKFDLGYNPLSFAGVMGLLLKHSTKSGVRLVTFERLHWFNSYLACWYIISKHRSSSIKVTIHWFLTELWAFIKTYHKNWCPFNNFWKTASIRFIFGMLIYNIKTQVKFDLGYNPLIFDGDMGLF